MGYILRTVWDIVNVVVEIETRLSGLGARIRAAREERGETQAAVATAVGIHRTDLSQIENGRTNITMSTLYRLADHLQVPAAEFVPD
ncbi:transcriptional regulatory protein [Mycobacteroides abscessus subsp. bolletii]|nr:transcriptional regulatory protein [Mycobacteroides abscessus subsp. bolletii]SKX37857.1 transcriptional regulatory protein [Mycobacteroides abscessus subsp. bolletii]